MLLQIEHLRVSLGGAPVLHDVSLRIEAGEIFGLIGPNGAGKTTTIAAALGLVKPDTGEIVMFGRTLEDGASSVRGRVGVVPEQNGFYDWMSAEHYLGFYASLYGQSLSRPEIDARLARVGLAPRAEQPIGAFSHGMRQRLALARALIGDPKLIILDEPTNGLDPRGRRELHDILRDLAGNGAGILLCTHLLDDVERLCRRVAIIVDGRTVAEGRIADLVRPSGFLARFRLRLAGEMPYRHGGEGIVSVVAREDGWWIVDIDPDKAPDTAWRELIFSGWPITEIRREGGGLEDLYLSLTEKAAA